jgi:hypothetical protein
MARVNNFALTRLTKVVTIADVTAPKLATEISAVGSKELVSNLTKNYDLGVDKSDSISEVGVNDRSKSDLRTIGGYHGSLEFFRDLDPSTNLPMATDCTKLIGEGEYFYVVRRVGFPAATAYAVGQEVEVYYFQSDFWQFPQGDGMVKAKIELFQLAQFKTNAVIAT